MNEIITTYNCKLIVYNNGQIYTQQGQPVFMDNNDGMLFLEDGTRLGYIYNNNNGQPQQNRNSIFGNGGLVNNGGNTITNGRFNSQAEENNAPVNSAPSTATSELYVNTKNTTTNNVPVPTNNVPRHTMDKLIPIDGHEYKLYTRPGLISYKEVINNTYYKWVVKENIKDTDEVLKDMNKAEHDIPYNEAKAINKERAFKFENYEGEAIYAYNTDTLKEETRFLGLISDSNVIVDSVIIKKLFKKPSADELKLNSRRISVADESDFLRNNLVNGLSSLAKIINNKNIVVDDKILETSLRELDKIITDRINIGLKKTFNTISIDLFSEDYNDLVEFINNEPDKKKRNVLEFVINKIEKEMIKEAYIKPIELDEITTDKIGFFCYNRSMKIILTNEDLSYELSNITDKEPVRVDRIVSNDLYVFIKTLDKNGTLANSPCYIYDVVKNVFIRVDKTLDNEYILLKEEI